MPRHTASPDSWAISVAHLPLPLIQPRSVLELSPRQAEVLALLHRPNKEIEAALGLRPGTVKAHIGALLVKAGCRRSELIARRGVTYEISR
jgi:DNA-binding NarL/FixJ family response regulator